MSNSTVVAVGAVAKPTNVEVRVVRQTHNVFDITLINEDQTVPDITADLITFDLAERKGGRVRLTKTAAIQNGPSGIARLTLTVADLTFNGISDDLDYEWVYSIRRQVGSTGALETVYLEGTFWLLSTSSTANPL